MVINWSIQYFFQIILLLIWFRSDKFKIKKHATHNISFDADYFCICKNIFVWMQIAFRRACWILILVFDVDNCKGRLGTTPVFQTLLAALSSPAITISKDKVPWSNKYIFSVHRINVSMTLISHLLMLFSQFVVVFWKRINYGMNSVAMN
jgi:hypothetical protein